MFKLCTGSIHIRTGSIHKLLDSNLIRAIPFEKLVEGVSGARLKNATGWSENSSEITAGWSDGPFFALS